MNMLQTDFSWKFAFVRCLKYVFFFLICIFTFYETKQMPNDYLKRMKLEVGLNVN